MAENQDIIDISNMGEGIVEDNGDDVGEDETNDTEYGITFNTEDIIIDKNNESFSIDTPLFAATLPSQITNARFDLNWINNNTDTGLNCDFEYSEEYKINSVNDWSFPLTLKQFDESLDAFNFFSNIGDNTIITVTLTDTNNDINLYSLNVLFNKYDDYIQLTETIEEDTGNETSNTNITGEVRNNKNIFQARVFMEQDSNVYGAEVILFGSRTEEPIEKILITDITDFDRLNSIVETLQDAYIPYTSEDKTLFDITTDYFSNRDDTEKEAKYLAVKDKWSYLKRKGNLEKILDNNLNIDDDLRESYINNNQCVINATHLNGVTAGDFSKNDHTHEGYLSSVHSNIYGNTSQYGHVRIVDNLTSTEATGSALSAKQGNELNKKITSLENTIKNTWNNKTVINKYLTIRVNPLLRLVVANYNRTAYTGLKKETGIHQLHSAGTLREFAPSSRVLTPVYRGDIVLMFNTDGGVNIHNLSKHDSWNIHAQVMWHY